MRQRLKVIMVKTVETNTTKWFYEGNEMKMIEEWHRIEIARHVLKRTVCLQKLLAFFRRDEKWMFFHYWSVNVWILKSTLQLREERGRTGGRGVRGRSVKCMEHEYETGLRVGYNERFLTNGKENDGEKREWRT